LLMQEIEGLSNSGFDLELTGFSMDDFAGESGIPEDNKNIDEDEMAETENECPKCGFKW
jgi:hypothetical protein